MSAQEPPLSEEEIRALEQELEKVTIDDVLLQTIVSLINLGARKGAIGAPPEAGLKPDYEQLRTAIEAVRALLPILEPRHADQLGPIRDAVSQLQMAYARGAGQAGSVPSADDAGGAQSPPQGGTGPAQRSSRLWVPGQ